MYITPIQLKKSVNQLKSNNQKVNAFLGLITLLMHGDELGENYWKSNMVNVAKHLDATLYINENKPNRGEDKFWFTLLQPDWLEKVFELMLKNQKISIQDCAIVLMWNKPFKNIGELIKDFTDKINCQPLINKCFSLNVTEQLTSTVVPTVADLKGIFNIDSGHCTLNFDSEKLLAKPAGDLTSAPYVQTLYAGTSFRKAFTVNDFDFLDTYKLSPPLKTKRMQPASNFDLSNFIDSLQQSNLTFKKAVSYRFTAALQTKPFVILTGLSGSGKTKLAEAFSLWICESEEQYCMVSVGADWTNREPLLGFPNALDEGQYIKPDCGALDLILRAKEDAEHPYFLILDEMNMSHVERYFADFLSAMESIQGTITLHPEGEAWNDCEVPATISLPKNLFVIGTVNIDETTYMFSPKVLDRANVIEFRVSNDEMAGYFSAPKPLDMGALEAAGASMAGSFVNSAGDKSQVADGLGATLMPFFDKLQAVGAEFGYRTAAEMSRFVAICKVLADTTMSDDEVIDAAIIQKLLPKLHGSRNKIEKVLRALGSLCLEDSSLDAFLVDKNGADQHAVKYPLSYEKLNRMYQRVLADGFTSFAEA